MHYMASSPPSVTRHYQGGFLLLPVSHMSAVCQRVRVGQNEQQGTPLQDGGWGGGGAGRRKEGGGEGAHIPCATVLPIHKEALYCWLQDTLPTASNTHE